MFLTVLPWCVLCHLRCVKAQGPHTVKRKEQSRVLGAFDVRFRTKVASLRESCSPVFVFIPKSPLPASSDWTGLDNPEGNLDLLFRFPSFPLLLQDCGHSITVSACSRDSPTRHQVGWGCPLPRCTALPKWSIISLLFLSGLSMRFSLLQCL